MCGYNQQILPAGVKLLVKVAVSLIMGIAIALVLPPSFTMAQRIMAGIFVGAACLWITEALPPFATAIGAIVACVFGLGAPQGAMSGGGAKGYLVFLEPLVDPVIFLFLGGCIMALAVEKNGLDRWMARWFLLPFAKTERTFLLGVVLVTGLFSMFMSNTATTLMMLTLIKPMLEATKENRPLASATVMAVAFAANIGGMGTIVGSPPNAIAVAMLERRSVQISFAEWMSLGVPLSLILLLGLWFIVSRSVRGSADGARRQLTALIQKAIAEDAKEGALWSRMWVGAVFLATVALWITESLHGWNSGMVALLPVGLFAVTRVLDPEDLRKIPWEVIILIAGGLILGRGLEKTGLAERLLELLPEDIGSLKLVGILLITTILLSNFMSNTSAALMIMPLALMLVPDAPVRAALSVAWGASLAMSLPISTPPNAIAYGTGLFSTREMIIAGSSCTILGLLILLLLYLFAGAMIEGTFVN